MAKEEKKKEQDPNVSVDPLLNVQPDTRTEREKFVDEFTLIYQDKNPHDQAAAIVWAIDTMVTAALLEKEKGK